MENIIDESKRQKLNRNITGVIYEDRIWEQWYSQDIFKKELPKMTQKDYLFSCIEDELDRVIIDNRGKNKFTVKQFKDYVKRFEKSFKSLGLNQGDVICTISLTTPELYALKYASTNLGLITCNLNVLDVGINDVDGKNRLFKQIENINPKMIFSLDILEGNISEVINNEKFSNALKVTMPLEYSIPKYDPERLLMALKVTKDFLNGKKIKNKMSLNDFLNLGKKINDEELESIYKIGMPCNISFTSGTTGINKAVLLSHDANNALAFQQINGNFGFEKGTRHLALVPPFLAFWDADIVHAALCLGNENIIDLFLDYQKIPEYIKKHKAEGGIWSQYLWSSILEMPEKELKEVSERIKFAIIGGERCDKKSAKKFYDETGIYPMTGFGASEINTTFSITHPYCNKIGTAGLPLPFNNVKIVDESLNDLTYGKPGKLFITGPTLMNEYYNRPDLTKKAIYIDKNGTRWYYTGDYAVIDDDGCLTVLDRYQEPITIKSGNDVYKINLLDINELLKEISFIQESKVTATNNKIIFHISCEKYYNQNDLEEALIKELEGKIEKKYFPNLIIIYDKLPRTEVGKIDYKSLEEIGKKNIEINNDKKMSIIFVKKETSKKLLRKKK